MKRIFFVFSALFFLNTISFAQVKILFDATKAETAGNADWVIDADTHDLYWNPGPFFTGSDSDPQRYPTPAQSGVTSTTAETYWEGALSGWAVDLVNYGYSVETLPVSGQITYGQSSNAQDLSNYKVFVVDEPNIKFTSSEKTAILQFVQHGGGLFMISDHATSDRNGDGWDSPMIWNDLMSGTNPFGITFDSANFSQTSSNIPNLSNDTVINGPYGSVTQVKWSGGTSMTLNTSANSTVKGVVYKTSSSFGNSNVLVAHAQYGTGKVVAISDSSPFEDGTGDPNDQLYNGYYADANGNHELLIMNSTIWLVNTGGTVTNDLNEVTGDNNLTVYPNPSTGEFVVMPVDAEEATIKVFNMMGKLIYETPANGFKNATHLKLDNIANGSYVLTYTNTNGTRHKTITKTY